MIIMYKWFFYQLTGLILKLKLFIYSKMEPNQREDKTLQILNEVKKYPQTVWIFTILHLLNGTWF